MHHLPIIDISGLASVDPGERRRVAAEVGTACRGTGFFAITGHGVAPEVVERAFAASRAFFAQPVAAKAALAYARLSHNRGYVGLGTEALDAARGADQKEAFNLIWTDGAERPPNAWPSLPGWREDVQAYFDAVLAAGRLLHRAFALDIGLPEAFFADKIDRPLATLRLLHYPATGGTAEAAGAGAHTDYGNVTLLATDGTAGLQVRPRGSDQWVDAPTVPGGFICNIGDCLMRWTNDIYVSTPHKVIRPPHERYSIAFFLDPNPDAVISAIPACVPAGGVPKYPPTTTAAYLQSRFDATYKQDTVGT